MIIYNILIKMYAENIVVKIFFSLYLFSRSFQLANFVVTKNFKLTWFIYYYYYYFAFIEFKFQGGFSSRYKR